MTQTKNKTQALSSSPISFRIEAEDKKKKVFAFHQRPKSRISFKIEGKDYRIQEIQFLAELKVKTKKTVIAAIYSVCSQLFLPALNKPFILPPQFKNPSYR